jgi:hypothetical protein
MGKKTALHDLIEGYKKDGAVDTKGHAAQKETQKREADALLDVLVQQGNPLAILVKGFKEQGKQKTRGTK